jgi:hypothetical protein
LFHCIQDTPFEKGGFHFVPLGEGGLRGIENVRNDGMMEWWSDEASKYKSQISNKSQVPMNE